MNQIAAPATHRGDTIPPPDTNRSALSEAWYRALYAEPEHARPLVANGAARTARAGASPGVRDAASRDVGPSSTRGLAMQGARARPTFGVATLSRVRKETTSAVSPAARSWRSALARRMTCRLTLAEGVRIDLLLQQRGRRLHVVAVTHCGVPAEQRVAAALLRARAALLAHGVRLATSVSQKGTV